LNSSLQLEAATTAVTPGTSVPVVAHVRNTGDVDMHVVVRLVGVEDGWTAPPLVVGPLAPDEATLVELPITIPVGFPPCEHLAGIEAEPLDPTTGAPIGRPVFIEVVLDIGDGSQVRASLEPADVRGGGRGKFRVSMRNRGNTPLNVKLTGESPGDLLRVRFKQDEVVLPPGQFVDIRGKVHGARPLLGSERRLPFVVSIRSRGTPRHLDASFTQSPTLKSGMLKVLAVIAVICLWAGGLVYAVGRINEPKKSSTTAAAAANEGSDSSASSDANGSGDGSGGGSDGTSSDGSSSDGSTAGQAPQGTAEIKVGGKVKGDDPSGVTVSIEPTSLSGEETQGATFVGGAPAALTKHYGRLAADAPSLVAPDRSTTTDADGTWAFGGIPAPGFYLVTISKPGYATQKFVITASDDGSPVVLDADLVAGNGALSGAVVDEHDQALGGVDLTITDGTVTLSTVTPTTGDIGKWSVSGLTTPGTYLITASRRGYGDETKLVDLSAGGSVTDANITMHANVGSIKGTVKSATGPVGDVQVTVDDGKTKRTATTLTVDPKGTYILPQLPIPGSYTMTFTANGWIPQTQLVDLQGAQTVNVLLTSATGTVKGQVSEKGKGGLPEVGITISNETVSLKTTSATGESGQYLQTGVPPGTYNVTFEKFGYITQSALVDVGAGGIVTQDIALEAAPPESLQLTGHVSVIVKDKETGGLLSDSVDLPVSVTYTDEATGQDVDPVPTTNGTAVFDEVTPGLRTFHVSAFKYKPADITIQVIPKLDVSGTVFLEHNATVTGLLNDIHGNPISDTHLAVQATSVTNPTVVKDATIDGSHYTFDGTLDQGAWTLVGQGDDYAPNAPITLLIDTRRTIEQDITLQQLGHLAVTVDSLATDGTPSPLDGATVSINGPTPKTDDTQRGQVLFTGLLPGTYTLTVTKTNFAFGGGPASVNVTFDTTTNANVLLQPSPLSPDRADFRGTVVWDKNGTPEAVQGAVVRVTGTAYNFATFPFLISHPTVQSAPTGIDGSFVVPTANAFDYSRGDIVNITAPGFVPRPVDAADSTALSNQLVWGTRADALVLQPLGTEVQGFVTLVTTGADSPDQVSAQVTSPSGTGVTIQVHNTATPNVGSLQIIDPRVTGLNAMRPGDYQITFSKTGYDSVTVPLSVSPGVAFATLNATLVKRGKLPITVQCTAGATTITPATARVTVSRGAFSQTLVGASPLVFDNLVRTDPGNFADVYFVAAVAPGCADSSAPFTFTLAAGEQTPHTVTLDKLVTLTGRVLTKLSPTADDTTASPAPGAVVTATGTGTNTNPFSGSTDANGVFHIVGVMGNNTTGVGDHPGLEVDSYTMHATVSGYDEPSGGIPIVQGLAEGEDRTIPDIVLVAHPATLNFTVRDNATNAVLANVAISGTSSEINRTVDDNTDASGLKSFTDLEPASWTFNFSLENYQPLSQSFNLIPGAVVNYTAKLVPRFSKVTGTTSTKYGSAATIAEAGVHVEVTDLDGNPLDPAHETDSSAGTLTALALTGVGKYTIDQLLNGSYLITYTKAGYNSITDQITVNDGQTLLKNVTLTPTLIAVDVTVESAVGNDPIQGTRVTLTPVASQRSTQTYQSSPTGNDGKASFTQVLPGNYTVSITAVGGHLTVLDDTSLSVPLGGPDVDTIVTVQEALLDGSVTLRNGKVPPSNNDDPANAFTVRVYNGGSIGTSPDFTITTAGNGTFAKYVTPRNDGYTLSFTLTGYTSDQHSTGNTPVGATRSYDALLKKLASLTVTVRDSNNDPVSDATVTVKQGSTTLGTDSTGPYTFSNLPPDVVLTVSATKSFSQTIQTGGSPTTTTTIVRGAYTETGSDTITLDPGQSGNLQINLSCTSGDCTP
jgi:hypothetical protein